MGKLAWWTRPDGRVAALSLWLALVTFGAHALWLQAGEHPSVTAGLLPPWALALAFAVTEGFAVHIRVRRGGHSIGLSEIPMVLGLLGTDPTTLLVVRMVGAGAGLVFLRRQRGVKLAFNLSLFGVQTTVAAVVFRLLAHPSSDPGLWQWLAVYVAMLATDVIAATLVTAVIALHDDPSEWRRLPAAMRGVPFVGITTTVGLVSALALLNDIRAVVLLAAAAVVMFLGYRGYMRQSQGHEQVEELYAFTRALDSSLDSAGVARVVLEQARDQLRAEVAELFMPTGDGQLLKLRLHGHDQLDRTELADGPPIGVWWRPAFDGEPVLVTKPASVVDGIAVPLPFADRTTGALVVYESLPDIETFDETAVRLFQALANHASVALARTWLVTELRQEVAEKEYLALHDPLTDLPNRQSFHRAVDSLTGTGSPAAVLLLDLDRFQEVNDALGHDTGDALLRAAAARIRDLVGERGTVARFGGDEFAVLLPGVKSREAALAVGDELLGVLEQSIAIGELRLSARASMGVALAPEHGTDAKLLIQRADIAMYVAKSTRSGIRVYQSEDDRNSPRRVAMVADLREAIQRHDLVVTFQPKVDPSTDKVVGAEALCRWHHPAHGTVPPDEFIPLAEHAGLIRPLTLHVLEVSLRRCAAWRRAGHDLGVAVNLAPSTLLDPDLPDLVSRLLGQSGVPAGALTLEITEGSILADPDGSILTLDRLHTLGVKASIDDFGTGYSSLGRLRALPIHEVKIDKSFVQRIALDHRDRAVVRSAIELGHALDLAVVAEGVEDADTYAYLAREGCDLVQGYFVSRPLLADDFANWLSARLAVGR
jgi:diguanylate cyclase (GGDEF)-like protein